MTLFKPTVFSLLAFSQLTSAQIVNTDSIVKQADELQRTTQRLENRLTSPIKDPAFSLSTLPAIEEVITEPLTSLPKTLAISADITTPILMEVEVEDGWRAIKNQWLILADQQTKHTLVNLGASIESSNAYAGLGLSLLHFSVPDALDAKHLLAAHLSVESAATLDRNHIYQAQSRPAELNPQQLVTGGQSAMCDTPVNIGMIDSAIDTQHRAFSYAQIKAQSFLLQGLSSPSQHGTAIASVLVGKAEELQPLLPQAQLYSAEVFYRQSDYAQGATLSAIIAALNWLIEQRVQVINMSLAGPDNRILERVINAASDNRVFIVAAAGNEGPAAPPVYPAGYDSVIAVSAFDQQFQPYRWSNRGDYIDYSGLGVNVISAQAQQQLGKESGTSMAAPVVSAALACLLAKQDKTEILHRDKVLLSLAEQAIDLGPKGRDAIYGIGAIHRKPH